jgi:ribonuclease P protein component
MPEQRFPHECRIRSSLDFQRAYARRCAASDDRLLVFGVANGLPYARLGLSVSRKVGNAVVRNRWKRLIREAFRLERQGLPPGIDLVVVPRGEAEPELEDLRRSLARLASRVKHRASTGGKAATDGHQASGRNKAAREM